MFTVTGLYIYPVKSLGGSSMESVQMITTGFKYDRRWMLIDENNQFLTQRVFPVMALLVASVSDNYLLIEYKSDSDQTLRIPLVPDLQLFAQVKIWDDECRAQFVSEEADKWFSKILGINCRLVYMPDETKRMVDDRYASNSEITTFTDGYPTLIIGEESLADLNSRLSEPLPMNRFRPNIVFSGGLPHDEDFFEHFKIGAVEFMGVKLCARCVVTTIDQQTLSKGKEPLKTLAGYRFKNNKIYFGQNLLHKGEGIITKGDEIIMIKKKEVQPVLL